MHARQVTVCRQIGQLTPQPAQRFDPLGLVAWVAKQIAAGAKVHSCYEAGPCGYVLHRQLVALGAINLVVVPQKLEGARRQKTDRLDARALVERLDRYLAGNTQALGLVRVPTVEQEQLRAESRQRDQFSRMRRQAEARGRSLLLSQGYHLVPQGRRGPRRWLQPRLPEWIVGQLQAWQALAAQADRHDRTLRAKLEESAPRDCLGGSGR